MKNRLHKNSYTLVAGGSVDRLAADIYEINSCFRNPDPEVHHTAYIKPSAGMVSEGGVVSLAFAISSDSKHVLIRRLPRISSRDQYPLTLWDIKNTDRPIHSFNAR